MADAVDWTAEVEAIKSRLAVIEEAATGAGIPRRVMEELKSAVDHCRTTLWAALLAAQGRAYQGISVVVAARIDRVQEMCRRIIQDVASAHIGKETPGIAACHAILAETQQALRSLFNG